LTETDKQIQIATIVSAHSGTLIDQETAVAQAAPIFGVQDAPAMLERVQKEQSAQQANMYGNTYTDEENANLPTVPDDVQPEAGAGGLP
jgi:hypothetical protein